MKKDLVLPKLFTIFDYQNKENMKIEVYKLKNGLHLPCKFPQSVKRGTLEYFIYGEGYKKTKDFTIIEIELPDSKDNLVDLALTQAQYGKEVCMEYLLTNNADCWKQNMFYKAKKVYSIIGEDVKLLPEIIQKSIHFDFFGMFDIIVFDERLAQYDSEYEHINCRYKGKPEYSTEMYLKEAYSNEVYELINKLI